MIKLISHIASNTSLIFKKHHTSNQIDMFYIVEDALDVRMCQNWFARCGNLDLNDIERSGRPVKARNPSKKGNALCLVGSEGHYIHF